MLRHMCRGLHPARLRGCERSAATANGAVEFNRETPIINDPELAKAKPFKEMPGANLLFMLNRILTTFSPFKPKPISLSDIHMTLYRDFGVISKVTFPGQKYGFVFLFDPNDIQKVYQHEGRYPYRDHVPNITKYRRSRSDVYPNKGLVCENGEGWHQIRSKVQLSLMKPQIVETYLPKMAALTDEFVDRLHNLRDAQHEVPNFIRELYRWAIEFTCLVAFNTRIGCLNAEQSGSNSEPQRMIDATVASFNAALEFEVLKPWKLFSSKKKAFAKFDANQNYIISVVNKYSEQTLERMIQSNKLEKEDLGAIGDVLHRTDITASDLQVVVLDMLMAGVETTSHAAAFLSYLLARNMKEQEKVHKELDLILPCVSTPITPEILHRLVWLRAAVKESLRLMATIDGTYRVLDHDIVLSGYHVPAGATLLLATQVASLLPQNFPDADKFLPGRWLSSVKHHPYANLPFSHGPRACVGRRIALQMLHLLFIKILQRYRIEYHHEDIGRISRLVHLPDKPVRVSFIERR